MSHQLAHPRSLRRSDPGTGRSLGSDAAGPALAGCAGAGAVRGAAGAGRYEVLASVRRRFVVRAPEGIAVVFGAAPVARAGELDMPLATWAVPLPETQVDPGALREGYADLRRRASATPTPKLGEPGPVGRRCGAMRTGHPPFRPRGNRSMTAQRLRRCCRGDALVRRVVAGGPGAGRAGVSRQVALLVLSSSRADRRLAHRPGRQRAGAHGAAWRLRRPAGLRVAGHGPLEAMRMAWHPRQSADPAHRWLRERMRQVLDEPRWIAPSVASLTTEAQRGVD